MTNGVAYVLSNGIEPVPVSDEQVEAVRRLVEGPYPVALWPLLQKGKRVRIIVGPLAGLETYIIARKGGTKCHLVVTVDILGRSVAVELEPHCVEPVC
jgi:transcription antitermination factor NusG